MPKFFYNATSADGRLAAGEIEASSAAEARRLLEEQGWRVELVRPLEKAAAEDATGADATASTRESGPAKETRSAKLTSKDFEFVGEQVAELTRSRLPLAPGLAALAEEIPDGRLRRGLRDMVSKLENGMALEDVLATSGAPDELRAVVRAGLRTGRTGELLAGYVARLRSRSAVRLQMAMAFGYPMAICLVAIGIGTFLLTYIVPSFRKIFDDFGTRLPAMTSGLIGLSDFMTQSGWFLLLGFVLLVVLAALGLRILRGPGAWKQLLRFVPVIGSLSHCSSMARLCHMLAVMIENHVPLPLALTLAADGTNDPAIRESCREMIRQVNAGQALAAPRHLVRGFPAALIRTLIEHKQADSLPAALHAVAETFENRASLGGHLMMAVGGPLLLCAGGMFLGYVVIALFMPLVKLLNALS